ncbi:M16 family metallopeptidase [Pseudonocardia hispaniensis]|uniref:M16 family metallopeptidase n=1 Tax=Pseudonocardia hispaniensis TaxID=904933 RepID=A0ABW1IXL0_9PSEU
MVTPGAGASDPAPGARSTVTRADLPGGIRLLTETLPGVHSVAFGIWIAIGSRDERPDQVGAAHFLEHLLFKGTGRRTAAAIAEEIDAVGGELNAFTAKEHTCYYAYVLDADLPLAVDVLADVVTDARLALTDVELERGVVLEEIAMRDDDPEGLVGELFDEALFAGHPLGRPVIGSEESIRAMNRDTLYEFWRGEYTAPRMVVTAAGNLVHERVEELAGAALAAAAARFDPGSVPVPPRTGATRPPAVTGPRLVLRSNDTEQAHLMLGVPAFDRHDPRRHALLVLNAALGGGLSSRLFQQVREQRGLAYSVYSAATTYADAGSLAVYAGCVPERLSEVVAVIRGVLDAVAADGLTEAELTRAKGSLRGGLVLGCEDTASRMNRLGRSELDHGRQRSISESLDRIAAVTGDEVSRVARELLSVPLTGAVVGPYDGLDELPAVLRELA